MECWTLLGNFHWIHIQVQQISYGCCIHIHKIQGSHIHGPSAQHGHKQSHIHGHNHILVQLIFYECCIHIHKTLGSHIHGPSAQHEHKQSHNQAKQTSCHIHGDMSVDDKPQSCNQSRVCLHTGSYHHHDHIQPQQISSCNHAQSHIRKIHDNDHGPGGHKIVHVHGDNHNQVQQTSYECCIHIHKTLGSHIHGPSAQHEHKQSHNQAQQTSCHIHGDMSVDDKLQSCNQSKACR